MAPIRHTALVTMMKRFGSHLLAALVLLQATHAWAEPDYPSRAVRILLGFGAGTPPDAVGRVLADRLSQKWGKPVLFENAIGAAGNVAGERVARADPDGHTLLLAASSGIVMNPSLYKNMAYDPLRDLVPVSIVFSYPNILVVHKDVPVNTVGELVTLARARPGLLTFGSAGVGTTQHLAGEMLKSIAQIDIVHVPYRGGIGQETDLIAGRIDMLFGVPTNVLVRAREGSVKPLAVTSAKRFSGAPELPTMVEAGFPEFEMTVWWALMAPSKTPAAIVDILHRETVNALAVPELRQRFQQLSVEPVGSSPLELSQTIAEEVPRWARIIQTAGVEPQ